MVKLKAKGCLPLEATFCYVAADGVQRKYITSHKFRHDLRLSNSILSWNLRFRGCRQALWRGALVRMHDTVEIEANARKEAKERMNRVKSLGGYDIVASKWHEFRPTESLGRVQLPLSILSRIETKGNVLPPLSSRSSGGVQAGDMNNYPTRLNSANRKGSFSCQDNDIQGLRNPRSLDYAFPRGFPMPGMLSSVSGVNDLFVIEAFYTCMPTQQFFEFPLRSSFKFLQTL